MAAEPAATAAASAAAAISAVMDWRSSPDARAAAFAYLESVCSTPLPRHLLFPFGLRFPESAFGLLNCSFDRCCIVLWRAFLVDAACCGWIFA
jgi:hypothetical protein